MNDTTPYHHLSDQRHNMDNNISNCEYQGPTHNTQNNNAPQGVGYVIDQNVIIGQPVHHSPPPFAGDGYYNPDFIVVRPRRRKCAFLSILSIILVSIGIFMLIKVMTTHH